MTTRGQRRTDPRRTEERCSGAQRVAPESAGLAFPETPGAASAATIQGAARTRAASLAGLPDPGPGVMGHHPRVPLGSGG